MRTPEPSEFCLHERDPIHPVLVALQQVHTAVRHFHRAIETERFSSLWIRYVDAGLNGSKRPNKLTQRQIAPDIARLIPLSSPPSLEDPADSEDPAHARSMLLSALSALYYDDYQKAQAVRRWIGLVPLGPAAQLQLRLLNERKADLRQACNDWQPLSGRPQARMSRKSRSQAFRLRLREIGAGRINLHQATRQLLLLPECPSSVTFFWTKSGRNVSIVTAEQARSIISSAVFDPDPDSDLPRTQAQALDRLDLAVAQGMTLRHTVRWTTDFLRANVLYGESRRGNWKSTNASMPFFYPHDPDRPEPELVKPDTTPPVKTDANTRVRRPTYQNVMAITRDLSAGPPPNEKRSPPSKAISGTR